MKKDCEHDWEFVKGWKDELEFDGDILSIPVKCALCKAKGKENYACEGVDEDED